MSFSLSWLTFCWIWYLLSAGGSRPFSPSSDFASLDTPLQPSQVRCPRNSLYLYFHNNHRVTILDNFECKVKFLLSLDVSNKCRESKTILCNFFSHVRNRKTKIKFENWVMSENLRHAITSFSDNMALNCWILFGESKLSFEQLSLRPPSQYSAIPAISILKLV